MLASDIAPDLARATDILVRDYCAVKPDESVLITADTHTNMTVVAAALNAANNIGAKSVVNVVPRMPFQGGLSNPYIAEPLAAAIAASDVWIDFMFPNIAGSDAYEHAIKRVRYIMCGDIKPDGVVRMFGRVNLDRLYDVHRSFIDVTNNAVGKEAHITNDRGSDVTCELGKLPFPKPRRAEKPGLYTVPGAMGLWPVPDKVKGYIVVDCCFHEYYAQLTPPLKLKIDGRIKEIAGGGPERKVMDRALRRAANGNYGKVIHFTVGAQPAARFTGQSFIEDQRVMGNNAIGLGTPFWEKGGGENHPDAVMSQQSVWIDGTQIVKDGVIVGPPKLKKYADKLEPLYA